MYYGDERVEIECLPERLGGRGLGIVGMCTLFREMGRSPVGARVFNCGPFARLGRAVS